MTTTLRALNRAMLAFALALGVGIGAFAVAQPSQAAAGGAYQVTVSRTGGFIGVNEQYTVSATTAHVSTPTLMHMAGSRRFRTLAASYPPAQPGADRFTYTVTVSYRDGTTKTVCTVDGAHAPAVLWQTVNLAMRISQDVTARSTA